MDSLRAETGIKTIEVNDNGECISFSVIDNNFFQTFYDFIVWMESQEDVIANMAKENESEKKDDLEYIGKIIKARGDIVKEACAKIDAIFGEDACKKVFCGIVPDFYAISDFLEKVTPFISKYAKERHENIVLKYNKNRKGARSK